jgi:hypothetical protein
VFFENVPNVVRDAMDIVVDELFFKRGLELRWSCMRAADSGAPHMRNRWFCLALQPGFSHTFSELNYARFDWSPGTEPKQLLPTVRRHRSQLLGNSVVPDAVRAAFFYLCTGFDSVEIESSTLCILDINDAGYDEQVCEHKWPLSGHISERGAYVVDKQPPSRARVLKLVLIGHDENPLNVSKMVTRRLVASTGVSKDFWATPRHSSGAPSNTLTERTISDLPTQLRFERGTPQSQRKWYPNPRGVADGLSSRLHSLTST